MRKRRIAALCLALLTLSFCVSCKNESQLLVYHQEKAATCTEDGYIAHYRSEDGVSIYLDAAGETSATEEEITISALGHDFTEWTENRVNCLFEGERGRSCSRCTETERQPLAPLNEHTFNTENRCTHCSYEIIGTEGLTYELIIEGGREVGYSVHGGTSVGTSVIIPCYHNKLPVIEIAKSAFQGREDLVGIVSYAELRAVRDSAFMDCTSLREIRLPESLITIEGNAFRSCRELVEIRIPDKTTSLGENAFYGCSNLKTLEIGASLESVGRGAFYNCCLLEIIRVSKENQTFSGDGNCLVEIASGLLIRGGNSSIIPNFVREIGELSFLGAEGLTSITIPAGVKKIGSYAFSGCINLKELQFEGSAAEWDAVEKGMGWSDHTQLTVYFAK